MNLVSIRLITDDVNRLVGFYEKATGLTAHWFTEDFAELNTARGTLAIGSARTAPGITPAANRSAIIEFLVDDVDALELPGRPNTMPWGNRSLLTPDPDGNVVNFFTPVTEVAKAKFGLS
ncbi:VOC family protein [Actinoplanes sp. NPDC049265]|uniref:VOC family protein n=1 Tax=Actinoplanes sp. NPDC049265 TaxID=3363902 RepID=UPI00371BD0A7